jgi:proton glutamate symport protein
MNRLHLLISPVLKKMSLTTWIFIGLFFGLGLGAFAPSMVPVVKPFQELFLHGVKCVIAPLIFATIVTGIASAGSFKQLGVMGFRTFIYFEVITTLALALGLLVVNILEPGTGVQLGAVKSDISSFSTAKITFSGFIGHLLPPNFADAMVRGDVLQIVMFSTLFGFGVLAVGEKAKPILNFCEALAQVMFKFVSYIMYLAPLGVCGALATSVSENGLQVVLPLFKLVGTLYFALALFVLFVLYPVCKIYKVPVLAFIKQVKDPVFFAFATTSSESAYPMALERLEKFGVPRRIASFVLPMGYSFNLDGSTLYLSLASVFVAQVAGINLSLGQQLLIMLTLMLTTKGVAAVPRTSIVVLSGTLTTFGIPLEGIALILGVDAFMDMGRSAINLLGNCLATAVIARSEGAQLGITAPEDVKSGTVIHAQGKTHLNRSLKPEALS